MFHATRFCVNPFAWNIEEKSTVSALSYEQNRSNPTFPSQQAGVRRACVLGELFSAGRRSFSGAQFRTAITGGLVSQALKAVVMIYVARVFGAAALRIVFVRQLGQCVSLYDRSIWSPDVRSSRSCSIQSFGMGTSQGNYRGPANSRRRRYAGRLGRFVLRSRGDSNRVVASDGFRTEQCGVVWVLRLGLPGAGAIESLGDRQHRMASAVASFHDYGVLFTRLHYLGFLRLCSCGSIGGDARTALAAPIHASVQRVPLRLPPIQCKV